MFRKEAGQRALPSSFPAGPRNHVASKAGLPVPKLNARLRGAIVEPAAQNMTKDAIERAHQKGQGGDARITTTNPL